MVQQGACRQLSLRPNSLDMCWKVQSPVQSVQRQCPSSWGGYTGFQQVITAKYLHEGGRPCRWQYGTFTRHVVSRRTITAQRLLIPLCSLQKGTCIVAGGSEAQNEKTQELAANLIGCKAFNRSELHVQASASPHLLELSLGNASRRSLAVTVCSDSRTQRADRQLLPTGCH